MISKENKIKQESSVSRQLQQQVPKTTLDGTYVKHTHVTQFDTADRIIAEDLIEEFIPVVEIIYKDEVISTIPKSSKLTELAPSSQLTEYNKIKVDIDREGHLFYFDWTNNNKRIHLRHPTGTYWTIDDDGNYNFKTIRDYKKIVKGSEYSVINLGLNSSIKKDRKIRVADVDYLSVGKQRNVSVGSTLGTVIGASEYRNIGGRRVTIIDNEEIIKIGRYKNQEITGQYSITSSDMIAFRAPLLVFDVGKFEFRSKSSITEKTSGKREIQSEKLVLSGIDGVSLSSMGNYSQVVKGISEETVSGIPSLPSGTDMKITTVNIGGYLVKTLMGSITLEAASPLPVSIKNPLGSIDIGLTGKIDLASPFADVSITETGSVTINGKMGSVNVGLGNLELDHSVMIKLGSGASSEFAVLGAKLMTWLNSHIHPTGTGPSGPPSTPATPTDFGSQKVFVE